MHREAPSRVRGAVGWVDRSAPDTPPVLVLPDGCMDIMWFDGALVVCGPDTGSGAVGPTPGTRLGLRFAPGHLSAVLGLPARAVTDLRVPLSELVGDQPSGA